MKHKSAAFVLTNAIFKLIPTILMVAYTWGLSTVAADEFHINVKMALTLFTIGMTLAFFLYSYNIRFSISFLMLLAAFGGGYKLVNSLAGGEFDVFYNAMAFLGYGSVFLVAWLVGYGFARWSYFPWVMALLLFLFTVSMLVQDYFSLETLVSAQLVGGLSDWFFGVRTILHRTFIALFLMFAPVLFYSVYIIFISELFRRFDTAHPPKLSFLLRRTVTVTLLLILVLFSPIIYVMLFGFPGALEKRLADARVHSANFLKKTYNQKTNQPEFDLNDYAQLLPEVKLSDETVFCTYIDNFFPTRDGKRIPLPVHFRRFVLNRYEPKGEKFVLDPYPPSAIPNDLFSPKPRDIPIGFSVEDTVIKRSTAVYKNRRNIASTVYVQTLSPDAYVAPNTGYSYQKLPVPPEDRKTFHTAYQCSSLVSIWNLPPFMYSTTHPELAAFRELRARELRKDESYAGLDSTFLSYYTQIDTTDTMLINLSRRITAGKKTPYDKVEAIVDYFLSNDESTGKPRFTYTLKPGSPKKPGQTFMHYFLFENHKGYCTYFAGATTLLLRAAGIPTRMAVGYAIFDRSNKNTGWYWVYADQGHAWVEVYFPSYGWIDFDTTPTDDTEPVRPPKPDGTPPQYAREPIFAVLGNVQGFNSDTTGLVVSPYKFRYRTKAYDIPADQAQNFIIRPRDGKVTIEGQAQPLAGVEMRDNMVVSAYSFNYALEKIPEFSGNQPFMKWFVHHFPKQVPVDEAIIVYEEQKEEPGVVFVVDGRIQSIEDSTTVTVLPRKIVYRGKEFTVDVRKIGPLHLKPNKPVIRVKDHEEPLSRFMSGDSMLITAKSGHQSLKKLRPYLATESFAAWFKNSFPTIIPVDEITLHVQETPFFTRFLRFVGLLIGLLLVGLLLLATLLYWYYGIRIQTARGKQRLYWVYRYTLMLLNQLGYSRRTETPLEFAHSRVDPRFGTQMTRFMNIYLQEKYAPLEFRKEDEQMVNTFLNQFKEKVLGEYSRWDVVKKFLNFRRTLQFLLRG